MEDQFMDYGFPEEEDPELGEVSAFCGCGAELDSEELQLAARTGESCCTMCLYAEESGSELAWEDQIVPGSKTLLDFGLLKVRQLTESEDTLLRGTYRETFWKVKLTSGAAATMVLHSTFKFPNETGGMCFGPPGKREITRVTWLKNTSAHPRGLYIPDGQQWFDQIMKYKKMGYEWKAWWHSHPGFAPLPSGIDVAWHKHKVHMLICNPKAGEIRGYDWNKQDPNELMEVRLEVQG